jgi:hypothetical protein
MMGLFNFALPPAKFSPSCILGLERAGLVLLDACIYGGDTPALREKLNLLMGVFKVVGEQWPLAKSIANEMNGIIKDFVSTVPPVPPGPPAAPDEAWDAFINSVEPNFAADSGGFFFPQPRTVQDMNEWFSGFLA